MIWFVLLLGIVGDFLIVYVLALFYPGYSHNKQVMSSLGSLESPVCNIYSTWLVILGVIFIIASFEIYFLIKSYSKTAGIFSFCIVYVYGIGAGIIAGVFKISNDLNSLSSKIHGIGSGIGFIALVFLSLVIGLTLLRQDNHVFGICFLNIFVVSVFFFILFVISEREVYANSIISLTGLWQRILLLLMYSPLIYIAIKQINNKVIK